MVNYLFLIILHLLGDFYLQTTKVAQCKNAKKGSSCGACKKCKESKACDRYTSLLRGDGQHHVQHHDRVGYDVVMVNRFADVDLQRKNVLE